MGNYGSLLGGLGQVMSQQEYEMRRQLEEMKMHQMMGMSPYSDHAPKEEPKKTPKNEDETLLLLTDEE